MSGITKAIWLIESTLGDSITLDHLADHAGLSRSHLSRLFPQVTGYPIFAYLRGRRLTEAAKLMAGGAPDILQVALGAGYNSHEAFTRAFREQFGITPEELRRRRSLQFLQLVEPLPMQTAAKTALPDPIIERRPSIRIAGLMGRHDMSNASSIPAQWQSFRPYLGNVAHQVPNGGAYGVVGDADESSFDYLCGVEVTSDAGLPPELTLVRVPEQRYARFRHEGHISTIRATIGAIFSDWLPRSGEEQSEQCGMVEYYGPDFDGRTGLGTTEIWLGLKG